MRLLLLAAAMLAPLVSAADRWIEYRTGPFHVISNAGDQKARERLVEVEQLRYALGVMLGKVGPGAGAQSKGELEAVWPIDVVLFSNAKEYGPHALSTPFVEGGSANLSAWSADTAMPHDWLRALTRTLIHDNSGRMPEPIEVALGDLFATIQVNNGVRVMVGAAPSTGELPPDRMKTWAKIQMLATQPEYSGKFRVYLNNLQQSGDEQLAARNAFGLTIPQLDAKVGAYLAAGNFTAVNVGGEAINPAHDFIEKPVPQADIDALMAELAAAGKNFPPESPRGLVAKLNPPALELASKANPKWGEPHFRMADLLDDPAAKIKELKAAATLDPRNVDYWIALAKAQTSANQYSDAAKSWAAAERAAPTESARVSIRQTHADFEERRADYEAAEKKRIADEKARDLQRVKDAAAAEVHAAEDAANKKLGGLKPGEKPVAWWDNPTGEKIAGKLTRTDCLGTQLRVTINIDGGGTIKLLVRDPQQIVVQGGGKAEFACGVQRAPRKIRLVYNLRADAKLDTVGDVAMVEFP